MRAAVYHGPRDVRIEAMPDPRQPGPREVTLEVVRAAICGTDASEYAHGPHMIPLTTRHPASGHLGPLILGHEFVGRVVAVGAAVADLSVGQRVVPGAGVWCEECEWCLAGRTNLCAHYYTLGLHAHGGLAEYATAPVRMCRVVPESCGDDSAAMAQPLAVALHALRRAGPRPGYTVALVGVGGIGAFLLAAAVAQGMGPIIAVDVDEERLATASTLGAAHLVDARDQDPAEAIRRLTGGEGAQIVIEASGAAQAPAMAVAATRRGGRVLIVGLQAEPRALDLFDMAMREVELTTTLAHVCDEDLPRALDILAATDLAPTVVDRLIGLDDLVPDGLRALAERRARGKILIDVRR